jgi:hypothetical protein
MNTPNQSHFPEPPSFESVSTKLKKILFDKIVEAVLEGTAHVPEYARWQAEAIDYALAPNLVRHKAKQSLISQGQETKDEEEQDNPTFEIEEVSNNGLYAVLPGFRVRILKSSDDGSVPPPGESEARQNFYNQQQALLDFADPTWNLIVHWTVDRDYNLLSLSVALPLKSYKNELGRVVVECAFDEPFWRRSPQSNVTVISEAPTPATPSLLDIPGIAEEAEEKTGEEPEKE